MIRRTIVVCSVLSLLPLAHAPRTPRGSHLPQSLPRSALAAARKPDIVSKMITFGPKRRRQMANYSKRHYGTRAWRLTDPQVIVEHYTDGTSMQSAWNYFEANSRHLGELPGVCSHFIIDTDGTIYQVVPLSTRCRHAIGMNYTAIGIEDVATSDRQVLHDKPQLRASLSLTLWLMDTYGIQLRNVIGHAEILTSPYHHELYSAWQCLTHSDWLRKDMNVYRKKLRALAVKRDVHIGPHAAPVDSGC